MLDIWVACDKLACRKFPLLLGYDPEVQVVQLLWLFLDRKYLMDRFHEVEQYLQARRQRTTKNAPSVYRQFGDPASFAVKSFEGILELRESLSEIQREAANKDREKCEELAAQKAKYKSMMEEHEDAECDLIDVLVVDAYGMEVYEPQHFSKKCSRCIIKTKAEALSITVHEWPVSENPDIAKATIFELQGPPLYRSWRDLSLYVQDAILNFKSAHPRTESRKKKLYGLEDHNVLVKYLGDERPENRLVLKSKIKSLFGTTKKKVCALHEKDVCVNNALRYAYFDTTSYSWSTELDICSMRTQELQYRMSERSEVLEHYLLKTPSAPDGPSTNDPLLAMPTLDFAKPESLVLMLQVIHQVGPSNGRVERANHSILADEPFCEAVLTHLPKALHENAGNWEAWRAVTIFSLLARRILGMTLSNAIAERCLNYLETVRELCDKWLHLLRDSMTSSNDDYRRTELHKKTSEIAWLYTSTFDVEETFLDGILEEPVNVSKFLSCSILIQEHADSKASDSGYLTNIRLSSWRSLMYRLLPRLHDIVLNDTSILNRAVSANWAGFRHSDDIPWTSLEEPQHICFKTTSGTSSVNLNLLTAELAVDGTPLTRLPTKYVEHGTYVALFGDFLMEAGPTDEAGFEYSGKSTYQGYNLHFGMEGADLHILAVKEKTRLELVPPHLFGDQLPEWFCRHFAHWYDHQHDQVILQHREHPWPSQKTETRWLLSRHSGFWRLSHGTRAMVSVTSDTALAISAIFSPLEDPMNLHILFDTSTLKTQPSLEIQLPRLGIDFDLRQGDHQILSRQYLGMAIDPDQRIGTLIGLVNKLVLRSATGRIVLIPDGSFAYSRPQMTDHVSVTTVNETATRVRAYELDNTLGQIRDDGSVHSKLLLAYLLALTSHCLPNPLSNTTGTEASLAILRSSSLRSFEFLSEQDLKLLAHISALAATHVPPKPDERTMQQVTWNEDLYPLSQHLQLRAEVHNILEQARRSRRFYPDSIPIPDTKDFDLEPSDRYLEERALMRSSTFRVCGFGAEQFTVKHDEEYQARDSDGDSSRGKRAYLATTLVVREHPALHTSIPDLKASLIGNHFQRASIKGITAGYGSKLLRYDPIWLDNASIILQGHWCNLHQSLHTLSNDGNVNIRFAIAMFVSTLAYSETADMTSIQAICALFRFSDLVAPGIPEVSKFDMLAGSVFKPHAIRGHISLASKDVSACPEGSIPKLPEETNVQHTQRVNNIWRPSQEAAFSKFEKYLLQKWPADKPSTPRAKDINTYFNVAIAMQPIALLFKTWNDNRKFLEYLSRLSKAMQRLEVSPVLAPCFVLISPPGNIDLSDGASRFYSAASIFNNPVPAVSGIEVPTEPAIPALLEGLSQLGQTLKEHGFDALCRYLALSSRSMSEKEYVKSLRGSRAALEVFENNNKTQCVPASPEINAQLEQYCQDCQLYSGELEFTLKMMVQGQGGSSDHIASSLNLAPRVSPSFWLSYLRQDRFEDLSVPWRTFIIQYAMSLVQLNRAHRMVALSTKATELAMELRNVGHCNWDPQEWPETLLMEAESGLTVRENQEAIAKEMRHPRENRNNVMQLAMGEGKSSVVSKQCNPAYEEATNQVSLLDPSHGRGGIDRQTLHGSSSCQQAAKQADVSNAPDADAILETCHECIANRGILLIQPEHRLSLKLMGIECTIAGSDAANSILNIEQLFKGKGRALVDECDETFNKLELIFTLGSVQAVDLAPQRWLIIQQVLGLVWQYTPQVKSVLPLSLEIKSDSDGRYPMVRILRNDAAELLQSLLTSHIMEYGLNGLPIRNEAEVLQRAIKRYISMPHLAETETEAVEGSRFWTASTKDILLLVRGLFAGGVLRFALSSKRYRVNYGLDPKRVPSTNLAVPYRFKDGPSMRSEFSHPDSLIVLTCLSYYYAGLDNEQLFDTFACLLKSDQAAIEYAEWIATATHDIPAAFRSVTSVNIKDRLLCMQEVFPHLRYSKNCIDFYLSRLVFPKQIRQFTSKISASGWDLGAITPHPTTGFSGTCDSQFLLPLTVKHLDLPEQRHSNALVLGHIFGDASEVELLPARTSGTDASHLLTAIANMKPEIRVVLDCGAQILEQSNQEVSELWLHMSDVHKIHACVFFNDEELSVLDRSGRIEPFQTSPFARQLDKCIIYLDEAHTRGIDLKLPRNYRAAVTLGAGLTKDRLMQACMRMRKLGQGQTVAFIVPEEISTKIRDRACMQDDDNISLVDVLGWCITETWLDLKKGMPLWAMQGARFFARELQSQGVDITKKQAEAWLEDEAQSLETRYKPRQSHLDHLKNWDMSNSKIQEISRRCEVFGVLGFSTAGLEEEQERELAPEKEEEREIEHPPNLDAADEMVHSDLRQLARVGKISGTSQAIMPAFQALRSTSAGPLYDLSDFPTSLHVTKDYMKTVKEPPGSAEDPFVLDPYQRPVQWIISVPGPKKADNISKLIIISPYEANELYSIIQKAGKVTLHLFAPRTNANYASLDQLQLWTTGCSFTPTSVPRTLIVQLNLFSGSLYLRSYGEYAELCDMLGLLRTNAQEDQLAQPDGFITTSVGQWNLVESPVPFFRALIMRIRREGEGLEKTQLGKILNGVRLEEADFNVDVHMTG
ncbi:hypothetical protein J1614_009294 [Plenodomus biglobosus]|nr:hypothetical protein J1614_009294 [Plenodomus biglobosus]